MLGVTGRSIRRITSALAVAVVALTTGLLAAPSASASTHHATAPSHHQEALGARSLAAVLARDGASFDHNWHDFDIVDAG